MAAVELTINSVAAGGAGVARDDDGRVTFVTGAIPGEVVLAELTREKKSHAFARVLAVVEPSPHRVEPSCPNVSRGCGGCGLPYVSREEQRRLKMTIARDSLTRFGGIAAPRVVDGPPLADAGFRTTVRAAVAGGRAGLRRASSHEVVTFESCPVAHPLVEQLLIDGRFGSYDEVTIRVGANTGERMVHLHGPVRDGASGHISVPDDVVVVFGDSADPSAKRSITETVASRSFRISAGSFFQTRADGAEALVDVVGAAIPNAVGRLIDLCCGVGLFAVTLNASEIIGVESNRSAISDFAANTAFLGGAARSVEGRFERWRPERADAVVADPSRSGLGVVGVDVVAATGASDVVLVSCDPAAMGRDVGLLTASGFRATQTTLVDLFPDTPHIEAVTHLSR